MTFTLSFAGAKEYTPFESSGDLYPFEGLTFGTIEKIEEDESKKGNHMLVFTLSCSETEAKGLKAKKWVPVSGMRSDNKPNIIGLLDLLQSYYSETMSDTEAVAKVRGLEGKEMSSTALTSELVGKKVYYEIQARSFQRDDGSTGWNSDVRNFVTRNKYTTQKDINQHHRPLPAGAGAGGSAAAPAVGGALANGAAPQAQQSAPKSAALGIL